jgi:hypothetical protein
MSATPKIKVLKTMTIVYDQRYGYWIKKLKLLISQKVPEIFERVEYIKFDNTLPINEGNTDIFVFVPHHSSGKYCTFSNKKFKTRYLDDVVNDIIKNGWTRIHLQSCQTSLCFRGMELRDPDILEESRVVVSGHIRQISGAKKKKRDTADEYLLNGCPQSSKCKEIVSGIEVMVFEKIGKKTVHKLIHAKK